MNKRTSKVTPAMFIEVKSLLKDKPYLTRSFIARKLRLSETTIVRINRSDTYDNYLKLVRSYSDKSKKPNPSKNNKGKAITQEDYDLIKLLLKKELTHSNISKVSGYSPTTISYIKLSENLADYHIIRRRIVEEHKPKTIKQNKDTGLMMVLVDIQKRLERIEINLEKSI